MNGLVFERGFRGKPKEKEEITKEPVVIVPPSSSPSGASVSSTGGRVPIGVKEGVEEPVVNPAVSPEYKQKVIDVREAPAGQVISRAPEKQPTKGQQISQSMGDIGRQIWFGGDTAPEQIAYGPDLRYKYQPSSRMRLAETSTNVFIGITGGSVIRYALPSANSASSILRIVNKASKVALTGVSVVGVGSEVLQTTQQYTKGEIPGSEVGYRAANLFLSTLSFAVGAGAFDQPLSRVTRFRMPKYQFREPEGIFENAYVKNIIGYKPKSTYQVKLGMSGNKYLLTNKGETIKLQTERMRIPEIRTTSAEPSVLRAQKKITPAIKTQQLSMYGAKVYEKPTTVIHSESKVPWRFKLITEQTRLKPTNTWIDIRFENGKMVLKEIPYEKVKFSSDITATQSLVPQLLLQDRPSRTTMFRSEIFTEGKTSIPRSFTFGFIKPPVSYNLRFTGELPIQKQKDLNMTIQGELNKQQQEMQQRQMQREEQRQRTERVSIPAILQGTQQIQTPVYETRQAQMVTPIQQQMNKSSKEVMRIVSLYKPIEGQSMVSSEKMNEQAFNVFIKDRTYVHGKKRYSERWKKANTKPLSETQALSLGATAVDQSAAASFKIRPAEGQPHPSPIPTNPWGTLQNKFYKKNNTYIEHTTHRIDSQGEIQGISALGWIANQNRLIKATVPVKTAYKMPEARNIMDIRGFTFDIDKVMRGMRL